MGRPQLGCTNTGKSSWFLVHQLWGGGTQVLHFWSAHHFQFPPQHSHKAHNRYESMYESMNPFRVPQPISTVWSSSQLSPTLCRHSPPHMHRHSLETIQSKCEQKEGPRSLGLGPFGKPHGKAFALLYNICKQITASNSDVIQITVTAPRNNPM